jgi:hypothetical protein
MLRGGITTVVVTQSPNFSPPSTRSLLLADGRISQVFGAQQRFFDADRGKRTTYGQEMGAVKPDG